MLPLVIGAGPPCISATRLAGDNKLRKVSTPSQAGKPDRQGPRSLVEVAGSARMSRSTTFFEPDR
jgi:hypothetical protein